MFYSVSTLCGWNILHAQLVIRYSLAKFDYCCTSFKLTVHHWPLCKGIILNQLEITRFIVRLLCYPEMEQMGLIFKLKFINFGTLTYSKQNSWNIGKIRFNSL